MGVWRNLPGLVLGLLLLNAMFAIEQSTYATRLKNNEHYLIAGSPSNEWQDHRTEFGPVFTF